MPAQRTSAGSGPLIRWIVPAALIGIVLWFVLPPRSGPRAGAAVAPPTYAELAENLPAPLVELGRGHRVRLVYFVPADREPREGQAGRMIMAMTFASDFLRRDLAAQGHATDGLDIARVNGEFGVAVVRGNRPAAWYRSDEARAEAREHASQSSDRDGHYWSVVHEVQRALGPPHRRIDVIFSDTHDLGEACFDAHGNLARGAQLSRDSGAVVISAWAASELGCAPEAWEQLALFDDLTMVEGCLRKDGSRVRLPRYEFAEESIGTLVHELGHALGLMHDFRTPREDVMGFGAKNLRPGYRGRSDAEPRVWISPQNALFLRHSPFLNYDVDVDDDVAPVLEGGWMAESAAGATRVELQVTATDDRELAALVFYSPKQDTILSGSEARGRRLEFRSDVPHPPLASGLVEIVAFALDRGGNRSAILMRGTVR